MTSLIAPMMPFNSTMVRLKANRRRSFEFVLLFQFHYGTIKRSTGVLLLFSLIYFQFHYGTIKRVSAKV